MKNKVIYGLVSALWYLLSLLPFWVHYLLSDFVCLVLYRLIGYRVKVVRGNLTSSFPEKSEAEIREIEQKFYHRLCDYFVEAVKMKTMSEQQMRRPPYGLQGYRVGQRVCGLRSVVCRLSGPFV